MKSAIWDKIEVAEAINNLQYINRWLNIDVAETIHSNIFTEYLTSKIDDSYDSRFEKVFSTTVYEFAKKIGYPSFIAKRISSYCEQDIRMQKLDVLKAEDKISAKQYDEEKKKLKFVTIISKASTRVVKIGVKSALSYGIQCVTGGAAIELMKWSGEPITMSVGWAAYGIMTAYEFLVPEKIKKEIKQTAIDAINNTWDLLKNGITELKNAGEEVVEGIKDAFQTGIEKIEEIYSTGYKYLNDVIGDAYEKVKSIYHWLTIEN